MTLLILFIVLQLAVNIILDKTGISQKHFTSSGGFILVVFCALWMLSSLFIFGDLFGSLFEGDFWHFLLFIEWVAGLIISPLVPFVVQLIYSYGIRRLILYKNNLKKHEV